MATKEQCIQAVAEAAGISRAEAREALDMVEKERQRIIAAGKIDKIDEQITQWAKDRANDAKVKAALQRKQAALNIMRRDPLENQIKSVENATRGNTKEGFLSILYGTHKRGVPEGRDSVNARRVAIVDEWIGGMTRDLQENPRAIKLLQRDPEFVDDVVREMHEIKENGKPGITGNKDAKFVADIFAKYSDISRKRLNDAGAFIRKLGGWVPQTHDEAKLLKAGKDAWVGKISKLLDFERSFPSASSEKIPEILGDIYDTIVTGRGNSITPAQRGEFVGPRNLARPLEHHRVLHFNDANAFLQYSREFGQKNFVTGMIAHLDLMARKASLMEKLGPNPEIMLNSMLESAKTRIKNDETIPIADRAKRINDLSSDLRTRQGPIGRAFAEVMGETYIRENPTAAAVSAGVRAIMSMAKLGGAVISSISDLLTHGMNARFNGINLFDSYKNAFESFLSGRGNKEQREIAHLLGTLYDGMVHDVAARWNAQDGVPGKMSSLMNTFFKWTGLNYWTDTLKAGYARMLSTHLAGQVERVASWADLDIGLRTSLEGMGFNENHLPILKAMVTKAADGRNYVFAENAARLSDDLIDSFNASKISDSAKVLKGEKLEKRIERMRSQTRRDIQTRFMAFMSDQTRYAVVEPDDRTRAAMVRGTRPGTLLGEIVRFVTQFKSFPIAYYQRNLSGGGRWGRPGQRFDAIGLAHLVAGSLAIGYAAMTAKDFLKGKLPRDPSKLETWFAAAVQSGGAGILGDFLFAKVNRFGGGPIDTAAGPALGVAGEVIQMGSELLRGKVEAGDALRLALDNTPFINLWYTRAVLDYAVLYHIREMLSPGTLSRMERRVKDEYNQEYILPPSRVIKTGGGFK